MVTSVANRSTDLLRQNASERRPDARGELRPRGDAEARPRVENDAMRAWSGAQNPMDNAFERGDPARVQLAQAGPAARVDAEGRVQRSPDAQRVIDQTLQRLGGSRERLHGMSPADLYRQQIAENPNVSDRQIMAMSRVRPNQLNTPAETATELREMQHYGIPQNTPQHRFTRDFMAGVMNADPAEVSRVAPAMGITGSAEFTARARAASAIGRQVAPYLPPPIGPIVGGISSLRNPVGLWIDRDTGRQVGTALHDATSYLEGAGVQGLNRSVWGVSGNARSAVRMYLGYRGLPPRN